MDIWSSELCLCHADSLPLKPPAPGCMVGRKHPAEETRCFYQYNEAIVFIYTEMVINSLFHCNIQQILVVFTVCSSSDLAPNMSITSGLSAQN